MNRRVALWLLLNAAWGALLFGVWMLADYYYVKDWWPPSRMERYGQVIQLALPLVAFGFNLWCLRRRGLIVHLAGTALGIVVAEAAWWGLFAAFAFRYHLAIGGTLQ